MYCQYQNIFNVVHQYPLAAPRGVRPTTTSRARLNTCTRCLVRTFSFSITIIFLLRRKGGCIRKVWRAEIEQSTGGDFEEIFLTGDPGHSYDYAHYFDLPDEGIPTENSRRIVLKGKGGK